jgi:hypothetical protein
MGKAPKGRRWQRIRRPAVATSSDSSCAEEQYVLLTDSGADSDSSKKRQQQPEQTAEQETSGNNDTDSSDVRDILEVSKPSFLFYLFAKIGTYSYFCCCYVVT